MENDDGALHRVIVELTRKNNQLEFIIDDLKDELKQTKALLRACRARLSDLVDEEV